MKDDDDDDDDDDHDRQERFSMSVFLNDCTHK